MTTSYSFVRGELDAGARHRDGVAHAVAGLGRVHRDAGALGDHAAAGRRRWGAAGRRPRAAACGPARCRCRASLPASVVLPAPCRPASRITVGGRLGQAQPARLAAEDADELLVDDLDDLLGGVERLADLGAERALLAPRPVNSRTTGSATSASSSAVRISRTVASTSASDSRPLPRRFLNVAASRSDSEVNNGRPHRQGAVDGAEAPGRSQGNRATGRAPAPPGGRRTGRVSRTRARPAP